MGIYHRGISFRKESRRALRGTGPENPARIAKLLCFSLATTTTFLSSTKPKLSRQENRRNTKLVSMDTVCVREQDRGTHE